MPDIYLSYDPDDLTAAEAVAAALDGEGWSVYVEELAREDDADAERQLRRSGCVVALWSESALTNELVLSEAAVGSGRSGLVNAIVEDVRPPRRFRRSPVADIVDWDRTNRTDPGVRDLISAVAAVLDRRAEQEEQAPFDPYYEEEENPEDEAAPPVNVFAGAPVDFAGHQGEVYDLAMSPDGALLATASEDGTVALWEVAAGSRLMEIRHRDEVNDVSFHPRRPILATASADGSVSLWDITNGALLRRAKHGKGEVFWTGFSPSGDVVASAGEDTRVVIWRCDDLDVVWELRHHEPVPAACFLPDGSVLAVASDDGNITLWDTEAGEILHVIDAHDEPIADLAASPDGRLLATASTAGRISVWNVGDGSLRWWSGEVSGPVYGIAFSPDGVYVAESDDAGISIWRAHDGDLVDFYTDASATRLEFSPAGQYLAWASDTEARAIAVSSAATAPGQE